MNTDLQSCKKILDDVIKDRENYPIDLLNVGDSLGEIGYIRSMQGSCLRTILDIFQYCHNEGISDFSKIRILEIGSFLGVVSLSLARLGFIVIASDIPQFNNNERIKKMYMENKVGVDATNLDNLPLPFESNSFDIVIMCETLEHLNFNPVEPLKEICRVLKKEGMCYITIPNLACLENRIALLRGRSVHHPIDYFFKQLDPRENMIVAIHWREYTKMEMIELLEGTGFKMNMHYFTDDINPNTKFARIRKLFLNYLPQLRASQVMFAIKR